MKNGMFSAHLMFNKVRKYDIPYLTVEDPSIQVRVRPAHYVYGCHMTMVKLVVLGYAPYQKGVIQGHSAHMRPTESSRPVFQDSVSDCIFIRCKITDRFFILHVGKINFEG